MRSAPVGGEIVSVMSTNAERGTKYAADHDIAKSVTSVDELVNDPDVEAVYISTTNELHTRSGARRCEGRKAYSVRKAAGDEPCRCARHGRGCRAADVVLATNHHLRNAASHTRDARRDRRRQDRHAACRQGLSCGLSAAASAGLAARHARKPAAASFSTSPCTTRIRCASCLATILSRRLPSRQIKRHGQGRAGGCGHGRACGSSPGSIAQFHDGFTTKYSETGFEVHGTEGSLVGRNVMTQKPVGTVTLRNVDGETELSSISNESLRNRLAKRSMPPLPARASHLPVARMASGRWRPALPSLRRQRPAPSSIDQPAFEKRIQ